MSNSVIEINQLSKVFSTEDMETHALKCINLNINKGDYVSICGPSGCGKSTLLSILGLLDKPTSGEYKIEGVEVSQLSHSEAAFIRNEKIGFIFQSFNLIDELSVYENIALPLRYRKNKLSSSKIDHLVKSYMAKLDISHRGNHRPNLLSGGQQQRVAIARALVAEPAILLIDEPTGNLDSKNGNAIMEILGQLNEEGTTICMVTHDTRYADMTKRQISLLDGAVHEIDKEKEKKKEAEVQ